MGVSSGLYGPDGNFAGLGEAWVAKKDAACLGCRERLTGPRGNKGALLFGEGGKQVEHERVHVWPKLSDPKGHLMGHQAADEMNVTAQPI
jgi:hypothetical protein